MAGVPWQTSVQALSLLQSMVLTWSGSDLLCARVTRDMLRLLWPQLVGLDVLKVAWVQLQAATAAARNTASARNSTCCVKMAAPCSRFCYYDKLFRERLSYAQTAMCLQVLAGAVVAQGESEAVISATGGSTFFGKTVALLAEPEEVGHLRKVRSLNPTTAVSSSPAVRACPLTSAA